MTKFWIACAALVACLGVVTPSRAQVVFSDNFDSENGGVGVLNYTGFAAWTVSNGSVDLAGNGFFDFFPGNGLYLDLDGTTGDAGVITSTPIALAPTSYLLEFDLGTISSGNTMTVSLGAAYSEVFSEASAGTSPTFNKITRTINVPSLSALPLVFDHQGGDNNGLFIDNVRISRVPEPTTVLLAAIGIVGVISRRHFANNSA